MVPGSQQPLHPGQGVCAAVIAQGTVPGAQAASRRSDSGEALWTVRTRPPSHKWASPNVAFECLFQDPLAVFKY